MLGVGFYTYLNLDPIIKIGYKEILKKKKNEGYKEC